MRAQRLLGARRHLRRADLGRAGQPRTSTRAALGQAEREQQLGIGRGAGLAQRAPQVAQRDLAVAERERPAARAEQQPCGARVLARLGGKHLRGDLLLGGTRLVQQQRGPAVKGRARGGDEAGQGRLAHLGVGEARRVRFEQADGGQ